MDSYNTAVEFAKNGHAVFEVQRGDDQWNRQLPFATADIEALKTYGSRYANYYLRTCAGDWRLNDTLYGMKLNKAHATDRTLQRDLRLLLRDGGLKALPITPTVELVDGSTLYLIFERHADDPQFVLEKEWPGAKIKLAKAVPLPGSIHVSGKPYRWRVPPTVPYARLPETFFPFLPKPEIAPDSILANVAVRAEYDPRAVARWDSYDEY